MTIYLETSDTISSNSAAFTLAEGDDLIVAPNVVIAATDYSCVTTSAGGVTIVNSGDIFGEFSGIESTDSNSSDAQITITNEPGGQIISSTDAAAILIFEDSFFITNRGTIENQGQGIETNSTGTFQNFGSLDGGFEDEAGIGQSVTVYNAGTMTGAQSSRALVRVLWRGHQRCRNDYQRRRDGWGRPPGRRRP